MTGQLWDAENGEDVFDEINLVEPGFNSGWKQIMGPMAANPGVSESSLVNFLVHNMLILFLVGQNQEESLILNFSIQQHLGQAMKMAFL